MPKVENAFGIFLLRKEKWKKKNTQQLLLLKQKLL